MKTVLAFAFLSTLSTNPAAAQPIIDRGGVLNAAGNASQGLPNSGIAQGSMFIVVGQNLGPADLVQAGACPLPVALAGTSVQVSAGNRVFNAIMIYTQARQIAALLPSATPAGDAALTVTYAGKTSAPASIRVVTSSFGIFARNQHGSGPAIVQNVSGEDRPVNALNAAAHPGQLMILWGTGLGPIPALDEGAPPLGTVTSDVDVLVGTKHATPLYAGRSGCCAGIDQIVFRIPDDVESGCYVPIAVSTGGVLGNFTTLSITASADACSDAAGLSAQDVANLQTGRPVRVANVNLSRFGSGVTAPVALSQATDEGAATFASFTPEQFLASTSAPGPSIAIPFGTCITFQTKTRGPEQPDPVTGVSLDAGPAVFIAGGNSTRSIPRISLGTYANRMLGGGVTFPGFPSPPPFLVPGAFLLNNGSGGASVGPFSFTFDLPGPVIWTNPDVIGRAIPRTQDLTITWSGGDPERQFIILSGVSMLATGAAAGFACRQTAGAGSFTIPAQILAALPASDSGPFSLPLGSFFAGTSLYGDTTSFQAPGIDIGRFTFTEYFSSSVRYQ